MRKTKKILINLNWEFHYLLWRRFYHGIKQQQQKHLLSRVPLVEQRFSSVDGCPVTTESDLKLFGTRAE